MAAKPAVMVNSCTGKMGRAVAEAAVKAGLQLVPYTLCGASEAASKQEIDVAGQQLQLVGPDTRDAVIQQVRRLGTGDAGGCGCCTAARLHAPMHARRLPCMHPCRHGACPSSPSLHSAHIACAHTCNARARPQVKQQHPDLIMIDYTLPDVIHDMATLYIKHATPFVMGTTGGDRQRLADEVAAAGLYAVIAPQMGKQVRTERERVSLGLTAGGRFWPPARQRAQRRPKQRMAAKGVQLGRQLGRQALLGTGIRQRACVCAVRRSLRSRR